MKVTQEKLKMRQLAKARKWETEMKSKVSEMRAVTIGCVWWMNNSCDVTTTTTTTTTPEQEELEKYSVGFSAVV